MSDRIWPRLGAASGAIYVVVLMVRPTLGDGAVVIAGELVAMMLFVAFAAYLTSVLQAAEGPGAWLAPTVLAAAVVDTSVKLGSAGAGYAARDLPDGSLHTALHDINYSADASIEPFIYRPDGPGCAARGINYIRSLETRS